MPVASRPRKIVAGLVAAVSLGVGGLTVAAVNPLGVAGAQGSGSHAGPRGDDRPGIERGSRSHPLDTVLQDLVAKGTLTEAQADAVRDGVRAEVKEQPRRRRQGRRGVVKTAAATIGITPEELATQLKAGKSIAEVAAAEGVERQTVLDALIKAAEARIDAVAKTGKIDAEKATDLKAKAREKLAKVVDRKKS